MLPFKIASRKLVLTYLKIARYILESTLQFQLKTIKQCILESGLDLDEGACVFIETN